MTTLDLKRSESLAPLTIWSKGAIPPEDWKYRNLKRVMFPTFDVLMVLAGLACFIFGTPTLETFFPSAIVQGYGIAMSISALACFIGLAFPKFWPADMAGSALLLGLSSGYVISIILRTVTIDTTRVFGFFFIGGTILIIIFRLTLLSVEWQQLRVNANKT